MAGLVLDAGTPRGERYYLERAVLQSLMTIPDCAAKAFPYLEARDFEVESHRRIFAALLGFYEDCGVLDVALALHRLPLADQDTAIDLTFESRPVPSEDICSQAAEDRLCSTFVEAYALALHNAARAAQGILGLSERCQEWLVEGKTPGEIAAALSDFVEEEGLHEIDSGRTPNLSRAADELKDYVRELRQGDGVLSTGFDALSTIALRPGCVWVVAGRPAMGKSTFALSIAHEVSRAGNGVAFFSLEMSKEDIRLNLIARDRGLDVSALRNLGNEKDANEIAKAVEKAAEDLKDLPVYFNDSLGTVNEIVAEAVRLKRVHGIRLLVVDYLGLVDGGDRFESRQVEVAKVSRAMKQLALRERIPVILVAQLNRQIEARRDRKPQLSDLRDSGSIEQDADVVVLLNRPGVYDSSVNIQHAEVIVAKNRWGEIGTAEMVFKGECSSFEDTAFPPRRDR